MGKLRYDDMEYILCAAILRKEPAAKIPIYFEHKQDVTKCELGWRHCDILIKFSGIVSKYPDSQGFFTSKARYVGRKEAMKIAINAGQVKEEDLHNPRIGLFSEDLY